MTIKRRFFILFILLTARVFGDEVGTIYTLYNTERFSNYKSAYSPEGWISKTSLSYLLDNNGELIQLSNNTYGLDIEDISYSDSFGEMYTYYDKLAEKFCFFNYDKEKGFTQNKKLESFVNNIYVEYYSEKRKPHKVKIYPKIDGLVPIAISFQDYEYVSAVTDTKILTLNKTLLLFVNNKLKVKDKIEIKSSGDIYFSPDKSRVLVDHFPMDNSFYKDDSSCSIDNLPDKTNIIDIIDLKSRETISIKKTSIKPDILGHYSNWDKVGRLRNTAYNWIDDKNIRIEYKMEGIKYEYILEVNNYTAKYIDSPFCEIPKIFGRMGSGTTFEINNSKNYLDFIKFYFKDILPVNYNSNDISPYYAIFEEELENSVSRYRVTIDATSFLDGGKTKYLPENLNSFYSLPWVEGKNGNGEGEKITIERIPAINYLLIANGYYDKNKTDLFKKNNRAKVLKIKYRGLEYKILLQDTFYIQEIPILLDDVNYVEIEILEVYKGDLWQDTCITYIGVKRED